MCKTRVKTLRCCGRFWYVILLKLSNMKKIILITATCFFCFSFISFAQPDTSIYLKGYNNKNFIHYFDSLHKENAATLKNLNHSYKCYILFRIKKNSMNNFEFIEIPKAPIPELAKKYICELFSTTNGMWEYHNKETSKLETREFLFSISLLKSNQTIKERMKDSEYYLEFALEYLKQHERLKGSSFFNENQITLSY